ncbi:right-handed parallel beta-helix repeat-containing protein [Deferrisoma camini]|uniref:right-handed parallel beta-helix repeat-containing protein n=1 Tax=Deferrisoma camini TaxID=1035120 RepID=UPI00046CCE05|nr:right-handed parallel beta-helix repeat-containing protein [Deferrisoma camini]
MGLRRWWLLGAATAVGLAACVTLPQPKTISVPATARTETRHILYAPTVWRGEVRLVRPLIVTKTATLTLLPGTRVYFDLPEPKAGEDPEPWIRVLGSLVALGTPEAPIEITSVPLRNNEFEDVISFEKAKEAHLRRVVFERGPWAVHSHFTPVEFEDCTFRNNYGGVRFQGGRVVIRGCRFEENRIGIRCLNSSPVIEENWFVGNLTGIFFRQGVTGAVLRRNNFDDREYDLKLGEAQTDDVDAGNNWWKADEKGRLADRIFDGADSEGVGRVNVEPRLPVPWGTPERKK